MQAADGNGGQPLKKQHAQLKSKAADASVFCFGTDSDHLHWLGDMPVRYGKIMCLL